MDFGLSDEQLQLKESARVFLSKECDTKKLRQFIGDAEGFPHDLYGEIDKLGWPGLIVPERFGGAGLGMLDMSVVLEECGYAGLPGPYLFSSAIAAAALVAGGSNDLNARWLTPLAAGRAIGTIAIVERNDSLNPVDLATVARREASCWVLNGAKMFVPYANVADFVIVAARADGEAALFAVDRKALGVNVSPPFKHLDATRRVCAIDLDAVVLDDSCKLSGDASLYERILATASIAIAADSLGGLERAFEMAVEYSKVREQFGKPIGAFQALQHAAAEIVADLEPARALVWYAAYALDALPAEASRAASMAKARMCETFMRGADRAVLMHGGIGFTWDHDIHFWFKRARFNEAYFGSPGYHRERVARLSGY